MLNIKKDNIIFLLVGLFAGLLIGIFVTSLVGITAYKAIKGTGGDRRYEAREEPVKKAGPIKEFYLSFEDKNDLSVFQAAGNTTFEISEYNATHGKHSLSVKISPDSDYPGLAWEVYGREVQNWSNAADFHFDVYNNTEDYIALTVKFKSGKKYPKKSFSRVVRLEPLKMNYIKILMQDIAYSSDVREMSYVKLFVESPKKEIILYFDNIGTKYEKGATSTEKTNEAAVIQREEDISPKTLEKGFKVFIASSLDKIFRDGKTLVKPSFSDSVSVSLAKNEYESFQIVIENGSGTLKSVRPWISDIVNEKTGAQFDKKYIMWRIVDYVQTKKPYYSVKFVGNWPDPLMPGEPTDIKPGVTQPFWITVYAPEDAQGGIYKGGIEVKAEDGQSHYVPITIEVFDFTLPVKSNLKTAFDFYPHITAKRYPQKEKETGEEYGRRIAWLNNLFVIDMLNHRINPILNIDPLNVGDLRMAEEYRRYGLNNFSIGKRGGTFNNNWPKDDGEIEKLLPLYRTYGENLKIHKIMDYHYIYTWDEGEIGNPQVAKITSMIHRAHPELKNMVCYHGFWDPEKNADWGKDIDIWCFGIGDFQETQFQKLKEAGLEMWTYVSGPGSSSFPNLAIDFDSMDYRIIPWLCWKYDINGFLYWCVNWWPLVDPFESASNTKWNQNGNGLLYYPGEDGPIDSLRLEVFRDGMEDYEYLVMLREKLRKMEDAGFGDKYSDRYKKYSELLKIDKPLASSMNVFTKDSQVLIKRREEIAKAIEEVDRLVR